MYLYNEVQYWRGVVWFCFPSAQSSQPWVLPKSPVTRAPSQLFSSSHKQLYNPHPWYCHVWFFGFGNCSANFLSLSLSLSLTSLCVQKLIYLSLYPGLFCFVSATFSGYASLLVIHQLALFLANDLC